MDFLQIQANDTDGDKSTTVEFLRTAPRGTTARKARPAAPGYAALAITTGPKMATRCARLRRACDHH
ncbi:hypothetical protein BST31_04465 [Mycobacterium marseillense]|nr:hypothetical protein BST31_04465 [Mycobacterium marseillense]